MTSPIQPPSLPAMVQWVVDVVVHGASYAGLAVSGDMWPEGNEAELERLAEQWHELAEALGVAEEELTAELAGLVSSYHGTTGQELEFSAYDLLGYSGGGGVVQLVRASLDRYMTVKLGAMNIAITKNAIIVEALVTGIAVLYAMIMAYWTVGTSTAAIPSLVGAGRMAVLRHAGNLLARLGSREAFSRVSWTALRAAGVEAIQEAAEESFIAAGAQLMTHGWNLDEWDWELIRTAAIAGAVAGPAGVFIFGSDFFGLGNAYARSRLRDSGLGQIAVRAGFGAIQNPPISALGGWVASGGEVSLWQAFRDGGFGAALVGATRGGLTAGGGLLGTAANPVQVSPVTGLATPRLERGLDPRFADPARLPSLRHILGQANLPPGSTAIPSSFLPPGSPGALGSPGSPGSPGSSGTSGSPAPAGAGEPAAPSRGREPIDLLVPGSNEQASADVNQVRGVLEQHFDGLELAGQRSLRVEFAVPAEGGTLVGLTILASDGQPVGSMTRMFGRDPDGTGFVEHINTVLADGQGRDQSGLVDNDPRLEAAYQELGFTEARRLPGGPGAVAAAAAGYQFDPDTASAAAGNVLTAARDHQPQALEAIQVRLGLDPNRPDPAGAALAELLLREQATSVDELLSQVGSGAAPTPQQILQIGDLGRVGLAGAEWAGQKPLVPQPGDAAPEGAPQPGGAAPADRVADQLRGWAAHQDPAVAELVHSAMAAEQDRSAAVAGLYQLLLPAGWTAVQVSQLAAVAAADLESARARLGDLAPERARRVTGQLDTLAEARQARAAALAGLATAAAGAQVERVELVAAGLDLQAAITDLAQLTDRLVRQLTDAGLPAELAAELVRQLAEGRAASAAPAVYEFDRWQLQDALGGPRLAPDTAQAVTRLPERLVRAGMPSATVDVLLQEMRDAVAGMSDVAGPQRMVGEVVGILDSLLPAEPAGASALAGPHQPVADAADRYAAELAQQPGGPLTQPPAPPSDPAPAAPDAAQVAGEAGPVPLPELASDLLGTLETAEFAGLRLQLQERSDGGPDLTVEPGFVVVRLAAYTADDPGWPVGRVVFTLVEDAGGQRSVEHVRVILLDGGRRRRGFLTAWHEHLEAWARQAGFGRFVVLAEDEAGALPWLRLGFNPQLDTQHQVGPVLAKFEQWLAGQPESGREASIVRDFLDRADRSVPGSRSFPSMAEVSRTEIGVAALWGTRMLLAKDLADSPAPPEPASSGAPEPAGQDRTAAPTGPEYHAAQLYGQLDRLAAALARVPGTEHVLQVAEVSLRGMLDQAAGLAPALAGPLAGLRAALVGAVVAELRALHGHQPDGTTTHEPQEHAQHRARREEIERELVTAASDLPAVADLVTHLADFVRASAQTVSEPRHSAGAMPDPFDHADQARQSAHRAIYQLLSGGEGGAATATGPSDPPGAGPDPVPADPPGAGPDPAPADRPGAEPASPPGTGPVTGPPDAPPPGPGEDLAAHRNPRVADAVAAATRAGEQGGVVSGRQEPGQLAARLPELPGRPGPDPASAGSELVQLVLELSPVVSDARHPVDAAAVLSGAGLLPALAALFDQHLPADQAGHARAALRTAVESTLAELAARAYLPGRLMAAGLPPVGAESAAALGSARLQGILQSLTLSATGPNHDSISILTAVREVQQLNDERSRQLLELARAVSAVPELAELSTQVVGLLRNTVLAEYATAAVRTKLRAVGRSGEEIEQELAELRRQAAPQHRADFIRGDLEAEMMLLDLLSRTQSAGADVATGVDALEAAAGALLPHPDQPAPGRYLDLADGVGGVFAAGGAELRAWAEELAAGFGRGIPLFAPVRALLPEALVAEVARWQAMSTLSNLVDALGRESGLTPGYAELLLSLAVQGYAADEIVREVEAVLAGLGRTDLTEVIVAAVEGLAAAEAQLRSARSALGGELTLGESEQTGGSLEWSDLQRLRLFAGDRVWDLLELVSERGRQAMLEARLTEAIVAFGGTAPDARSLVSLVTAYARQVRHEHQGSVPDVLDGLPDRAGAPDRYPAAPAGLEPADRLAREVALDQLVREVARAELNTLRFFATEREAGAGPGAPEDPGGSAGPDPGGPAPTGGDGPGPGRPPNPSPGAATPPDGRPGRDASPRPDDAGTIDPGPDGRPGRDAPPRPDDAGTVDPGAMVDTIRSAAAWVRRTAGGVFWRSGPAGPVAPAGSPAGDAALLERLAQRRLQAARDVAAAELAVYRRLLSGRGRELTLEQARAIAEAPADHGDRGLARALAARDDADRRWVEATDVFTALAGQLAEPGPVADEITRAVEREEVLLAADAFAAVLVTNLARQGVPPELAAAVLEQVIDAQVDTGQPDGPAGETPRTLGDLLTGLRRAGAAPDTVEALSDAVHQPGAAQSHLAGRTAGDPLWDALASVVPGTGAWNRGLGALLLETRQQERELPGPQPDSRAEPARPAAPAGRDGEPEPTPADSGRRRRPVRGALLAAALTLTSYTALRVAPAAEAAPPRPPAASAAPVPGSDTVDGQLPSPEPATPIRVPPPISGPAFAHNFPDPTFLQVEEGGQLVWYAYSTNFPADWVHPGGNLPVLRYDGVEWTPQPDALPELGAWAEPGWTWAPGVVRYSEDTFLLFYTARVSGTEATQAIGVAVADHPAGPFRDLPGGPLVTHHDTGDGGFGAIDAQPFIDADGRVFLTWKVDGTGNLFGQELWVGPGVVARVGEPQLLLDPASVPASWPDGHVEAPQIFAAEHHGATRWFLFFSGNHFHSAQYAVGYAVSDAGPMGPYRVVDPEPLLQASPAADGPGHSFVFREPGPDGRVFIAFHAWPPGEVGGPAGRQLFVQELPWDRETGLPQPVVPSREPIPAPQLAPPPVAVAGPAAAPARPASPEQVSDRSAPPDQAALPGESALPDESMPLDPAGSPIPPSGPPAPAPAPVATEAVPTSGSRRRRGQPPDPDPDPPAPGGPGFIRRMLSPFADPPAPAVASAQDGDGDGADPPATTPPAAGPPDQAGSPEQPGGPVPATAADGSGGSGTGPPSPPVPAAAGDPEPVPGGSDPDPGLRIRLDGGMEADAARFLAGQADRLEAGRVVEVTDALAAATGIATGERIVRFRPRGESQELVAVVRAEPGRTAPEVESVATNLVILRLPEHGLGRAQPDPAVLAVGIALVLDRATPSPLGWQDPSSYDLVTVRARVAGPAVELAASGEADPARADALRAEIAAGLAAVGTGGRGADAIPAEVLADQVGALLDAAAPGGAGAVVDGLLRELAHSGLPLPGRASAGFEVWLAAAIDAVRERGALLGQLVRAGLPLAAAERLLDAYPGTPAARRDGLVADALRAAQADHLTEPVRARLDEIARLDDRREAAEVDLLPRLAELGPFRLVFDRYAALVQAELELRTRPGPAQAELERVGVPPALAAAVVGELGGTRAAVTAGAVAPMRGPELAGRLVAAGVAPPVAERLADQLVGLRANGVTGRTARVLVRWVERLGPPAGAAAARLAPALAIVLGTGPAATTGPAVGDLPGLRQRRRADFAVTLRAAQAAAQDGLLDQLLGRELPAGTRELVGQIRAELAAERPAGVQQLGVAGGLIDPVAQDLATDVNAVLGHGGLSPRGDRGSVAPAGPVHGIGAGRRFTLSVQAGVRWRLVSLTVREGSGSLHWDGSGWVLPVPVGTPVDQARWLVTEAAAEVVDWQRSGLLPANWTGQRPDGILRLGPVPAEVWLSPGEGHVQARDVARLKRLLLHPFEQLNQLRRDGVPPTDPRWQALQHQLVEGAEALGLLLDPRQPSQVLGALVSAFPEVLRQDQSGSAATAVWRHTRDLLAQVQQLLGLPGDADYAFTRLVAELAEEHLQQAVLRRLVQQDAARTGHPEPDLAAARAWELSQSGPAEDLDQQIAAQFGDRSQTSQYDLRTRLERLGASTARVDKLLEQVWLHGDLLGPLLVHLAQAMRYAAQTEALADGFQAMLRDAGHTAEQAVVLAEQVAAGTEVAGLSLDPAQRRVAGLLQDAAAQARMYADAVPGKVAGVTGRTVAFRWARIDRWVERVLDTSQDRELMRDAVGRPFEPLGVLGSEWQMLRRTAEGLVRGTVTGLTVAFALGIPVAVAVALPLFAIPVVSGMTDRIFKMAAHVRGSYQSSPTVGRSMVRRLLPGLLGAAPTVALAPALPWIAPGQAQGLFRDAALAGPEPVSQGTRGWMDTVARRRYAAAEAREAVSRMRAGRLPVPNLDPFLDEVDALVGAAEVLTARAHRALRAGRDLSPDEQALLGQLHRDLTEVTGTLAEAARRQHASPAAPSTPPQPLSRRFYQARRAGQSMPTFAVKVALAALRGEPVHMAQGFPDVTGAAAVGAGEYSHAGASFDAGSGLATAVRSQAVRYATEQVGALLGEPAPRHRPRGVWRTLRRTWDPADHLGRERRSLPDYQAQRARARWPAPVVMASFGLIGLAGGLAPAAVAAGAGGALAFSQLTKYLDWIYRQETALAELRAQEAAAIGRAVHDAQRGHSGDPLAGLSDVAGTAAELAGRVGGWAADAAPESPPDQPTPRQRRRRLVRRAAMVIGPVVLALSLRGDVVQPPRSVLQPPRPEVPESVEPGPSESPDTPVEVAPESPPPTSEPPVEQPAEQPPAGSETAPPRVYEVVEGDRLWDISERFLGDPLRYPEVAAENPQLADRYPGFPDHIRPGDLVNLPTGATDRGPQRHATGAARPDPASAVQESAEAASPGTADPAVTVDGAGRTPGDPAGPGAVPPDGQPDPGQPPQPTAAVPDPASGSGTDSAPAPTTPPDPVPGTVPDGHRTTQHRRRRLAGGTDDPPPGDRPPPGRRHLHAVPDAGDAGSGGPAPPAPPGGPGDGGNGPGITPELVAELAGALVTDPAGTGAADAATALAAHLAELVRDPDLTGFDLRRVTGRFAELLGALRGEARARQDLFDHLVRVVGLSPVRAHGVATAASYDERGINSANGPDPFESTAAALVEAGVVGDVSTAWSQVRADPPLDRRLTALVRASYLRAAGQAGLDQLNPTWAGELAWHGPGSAERAAGTAGAVAHGLAQWVVARLAADQAESALVAQLSADLHTDRAVAAVRETASEAAARLGPVAELTRAVLSTIYGLLPEDSLAGQPPQRDLAVELVARRAQVAGRQAALAGEVAGLPGGAVLARPEIVVPGLQDAVRLPVFHHPEPVDLDQWERAAAGIRWRRLTDGGVTATVSGRKIALTTSAAGGRQELAFELVLDPAATAVVADRQDPTRYALRVPGRADPRDLPLLLLAGLAEPALLGDRHQVLRTYLFGQVQAAAAELGQVAGGPSRLGRALYHQDRLDRIWLEGSALDPLAPAADPGGPDAGATAPVGQPPVPPGPPDQLPGPPDLPPGPPDLPPGSAPDRLAGLVRELPQRVHTGAAEVGTWVDQAVDAARREVGPVPARFEPDLEAAITSVLALSRGVHGLLRQLSEYRLDLGSRRVDRLLGLVGQDELAEGAPGSVANRLGRGTTPERVETVLDLLDGLVTLRGRRHAAQQRLDQLVQQASGLVDTTRLSDPDHHLRRAAAVAARTVELFDARAEAHEVAVRLHDTAARAGIADPGRLVAAVVAQARASFDPRQITPPPAAPAWSELVQDGLIQDGPANLDPAARDRLERWTGELFRHELAALRLERHPGTGEVGTGTAVDGTSYHRGHQLPAPAPGPVLAGIAELRPGEWIGAAGEVLSNDPASGGRRLVLRTSDRIQLTLDVRTGSAAELDQLGGGEPGEVMAGYRIVAGTLAAAVRGRAHAELVLWDQSPPDQVRESLAHEAGELAARHRGRWRRLGQALAGRGWSRLGAALSGADPAQLEPASGSAAELAHAVGQAHQLLDFAGRQLAAGVARAATGRTGLLDAAVLDAAAVDDQLDRRRDAFALAAEDPRAVGRWTAARQHLPEQFQPLVDRLEQGDGAAALGFGPDGTVHPGDLPADLVPLVLDYFARSFDARVRRFGEAGELVTFYSGDQEVARAVQPAGDDRRRHLTTLDFLRARELAQLLAGGQPAEPGRLAGLLRELSAAPATSRTRLALPEDLLAGLEPGQPIEAPLLSTEDVRGAVPAGSGNVLLTIVARHGRDVSAFLAPGGPARIAYPPGTRLAVVDRRPDPDHGGWRIRAQQLGAGRDPAAGQRAWSEWLARRFGRGAPEPAGGPGQLQGLLAHLDQLARADAPPLTARQLAEEVDARLPELPAELAEVVTGPDRAGAAALASQIVTTVGRLAATGVAVPAVLQDLATAVIRSGHDLRQAMAELGLQPPPELAPVRPGPGYALPAGLGSWLADLEQRPAWQVAWVWDRLLEPDQRWQLITFHHELIRWHDRPYRPVPNLLGNIGGLPSGLRDLANRALLDAERSRPGSTDRRSGLAQLGRWLDADSDRMLLGLDPANGFLVAGTSDPDTADQVEVTVPGGSANLAATGIDAVRVHLRRLRLLAADAARADPGRRTAAVLWLGYQTPPDSMWRSLTQWQRPGAAYRGFALGGAAGLRRFAEALRVNTGGARLTYVGHSLGAAVIGAAAAGGLPTDQGGLAAGAGGLRADRLVFLGALGIMVDRVAELRLDGDPAADVFEATAPRDPIMLVQGVVTGAAPADAGARSLPTDPNTDHSGYFWQGNPVRDAIARIVTEPATAASATPEAPAVPDRAGRMSGDAGAVRIPRPVAALFGGGRAVDPPLQVDLATPLPGMDGSLARFARTAGWAGGENLYGQRLGGDRYLWYLSGVAVDRAPGGAVLPNLMLVREHGRGDRFPGFEPGIPELPDRVLGRKGGDPGSPGEPGYRLGGSYLSGGELHVLMWSRSRHNVLARLDPEDLRVLGTDPMPPDGPASPWAGVRWTPWIMPYHGHLYVYGVEDRAADRRYLHVARVAGDDLRQEWEFFTGSGWSPRQHDSARVLTGVAGEFSVTRWRDRFLLVTHDSTGPDGDQIVAYLAGSPTGPFTGRTPLYRLPAGPAGPEPAGPAPVAGNAREHPDLRAGDRLVISYDVRDQRGALPRFIEVVLQPPA